MSSVIRPSTFPMWAKCAFFESKEAGEAAERGTLQHEYLENLLRTGEVPQNILDEDEIIAVEWAYQYIIEWCGNVKPEVEQRLNWYENPDDFDPLFGGTADAIVGDNLFDYKSGSDHNYKYQMAGYAAMMCRARNLKSVTVHILYGKTKVVDKYVLDREAAESLVKYILDRRKNPQKYEPCEFCGWCALANKCPPLMEGAKAIVEGRPDWKLETFESSAIEKPEEMAKALKIARVISEWCAAVEFNAKKFVRASNQTLPGFKIWTRAGNREIDPVANLKLSEISGLTNEEILQCSTVSVSKLEKKMGKKTFSEKMGAVVAHKAEYFSLVEEKQDAKLPV